MVLSKELIMAKEVLLRKKYKIAIIKEKNGSFWGHLLKATYSLIKQIILFYGPMYLLLENTYGHFGKYLNKRRNEDCFIIKVLPKYSIMQHWVNIFIKPLLSGS